MKTSSKQISLFTEDPSMSSQEDSHANPTVRQENALAKTISAIYGHTCLEQYRKLSQHGSSVKMFVDSLVGMMDWSSRRCKLTWKLKVTKFNRSYFQLQASTRPIKETGYGLLHTPTAKGNQASPTMINRDRGSWGVMLPTPTAQAVSGGIVKDVKQKNGKYFRVNKKGERWGVRLQDIVASGLISTPTFNDGKNDTFPPSQKNRNSLVGQIMKNTETGRNSQLNPLFVEEMMGFPQNWTLLPFLNGEERP